MSLDIHDIGQRPVVVGGGIAGLMTALHLAPEPVVLLSKAPLGGGTASCLAQGGLAAAIGPDDSPSLHLADTLAAGDGLCDKAVALRVVEAAPEAIERLAKLGAAFDRGSDGALRLGLEAAHSRHRIVHAAGAATGSEVIRALVSAVARTPSITVMEGMEARRLFTEDGEVAGVLAVGGDGVFALPTRRVVLATGGVGGLFCDTTNPLGALGQGLALAARAGAELADLEFVQFHPTALDGPGQPMALISEAVRGEGAVLIDGHGKRFLATTAGGELAPRDVVARAVWHQLASGHRVFLDARQCLGSGFADRFPAIARFCRNAGIDPAIEAIPIRPAAHYHMGGVAVDLHGRSSVKGLWACGEVARTGLHGANRLASNSLVEAVVSSAWVAESVRETQARPSRRFCAGPIPPMPDASPIRPIVSRALGIVRDGDTLREASAALSALAAGPATGADPAAVALMMTVAALLREESRGSHFRSDFPGRNPAPGSRSLTLDAAIAAAAELTADTPFSIARRA